jgi:hypothetical protein
MSVVAPFSPAVLQIDAAAEVDRLVAAIRNCPSRHAAPRRDRRNVRAAWTAAWWRHSRHKRSAPSE